MGTSITRLPIPEKTILDAKAATGVGNNINVQDFQHCIFSFATDGGADAALTVKFQGSTSDTAPDFSSAQSVTNMWDFIQVIDLEDGSAIDGDTGVAVGVGISTTSPTTVKVTVCLTGVPPAVVPSATTMSVPSLPAV